MPPSSIPSLSPRAQSISSLPQLLFLSILFAQLCSPVVSSSCYYDSFTGRTVCNGLSYGARLAIAAAVTIVGAIAITGLSYVIRRRFYSPPPPVSAGYYGPPPPQTSYPPNVAYAQPYPQPYGQQPGGYQTAPPPVPAYVPPTGPPPPGYNPYASKDDSQPVPQHHQ